MEIAYQSVYGIDGVGWKQKDVCGIVSSSERSVVTSGVCLERSQGGCSDGDFSSVGGVQCGCSRFGDAVIFRVERFFEKVLLC